MTTRGRGTVLGDEGKAVGWLVSADGFAVMQNTVRQLVRKLLTRDESTTDCCEYREEVLKDAARA